MKGRKAPSKPLNHYMTQKTPNNREQSIVLLKIGFKKNGEWAAFTNDSCISAFSDSLRELINCNFTYQTIVFDYRFLNLYVGSSIRESQ